VKIPPVLSSTPATEQAVQDLLGSARPFGVFLIELPDGPERERAIVHMNEAMLWAHQAVMRAAGGKSLLLAAPAGELAQ